MGKRELLLIATFLVLGIAVWQVSAPRDPDQPGFSLVQSFRDFRAHMRGTRVPADVRRSVTAEVQQGVETLILPEVNGAVTVTGEDRDTVDCTLTGVIYVAEEKDREAGTAKVALTPSTEGSTLRLALSTPKARRAPKLNLEVRVPRGLRLELAASGETVRVASVRAVSAEFRNVEARLHQVAEVVDVRQRGGRIDVESAGSVTLDTRLAEVRLAQVRGKVGGKVSGDRIDLADVDGEIALEIRRADLDAVRVGPLTLESEGAEIVVRSLAAPLDVEARRGSVTVSMARPVTMDVRATGADVDVTLPEGGVTIEALVAGSGDLVVPSALGEPVRREGEKTWQHQVRGGGPLVRLRAEGSGDIAVR